MIYTGGLSEQDCVITLMKLQGYTNETIDNNTDIVLMVRRKFREALRNLLER